MIVAALFAVTLRASFIASGELQRRFGTQLRFVFRNFPLNQAHPQAEAAAETPEFAGAHGKFLEMHDLLYDNQQNLGSDLYLMLAERLGLSLESLQKGLETGKYRERVRADFMGGVRSGVNGTPRSTSTAGSTMLPSNLTYLWRR
jgi:protein-disulfide isomerase